MLMESTLRSCTMHLHRQTCARFPYFTNYSSKRRLCSSLSSRTRRAHPQFTSVIKPVTLAQHSQATVLTSNVRTYYINSNCNRTVNLAGAATTSLTSSSSSSSSSSQQEQRYEREQESKKKNRNCSKHEQEECVHEIHCNFPREIVPLITPTRLLNRFRSLLVQVVLYSASPLTPAQGIHVVKEVMDSTTREMIACAETSLRMLKYKKGQPWEITEKCTPIREQEEEISDMEYNTSTSEKAEKWRQLYNTKNSHKVEQYENNVKSLANRSSEFSSRLLLIGYEFERLYEQSVVQLLPEISDCVELLHMQNNVTTTEDKQHVNDNNYPVKPEMPNVILQQQPSPPPLEVIESLERNNKQQTKQENAKSIHKEKSTLGIESKERNSTTVIDYNSAMANTITRARPSLYAIADWMLLGLLLTDAQLRISVYGNYICYPVQPSMLLATYDVTGSCNFLPHAYSLSRFTTKMKDADVYICDVNTDRITNNNNWSVRGNPEKTVKISSTNNNVNVNGASNDATAIHNDWHLDFAEVAPEALYKSLQQLSQSFPEGAKLLRSHNIIGTSAKCVYNWTLSHSLFYIFEAFVERSVSNSKNIITETKYANITQEHKANNGYNHENANLNVFTGDNKGNKSTRGNEQHEYEQQEMEIQPSKQASERSANSHEEITLNQSSENSSSSSEFTSIQLPEEQRQPSLMYPLIRCFIANFDQNEGDMLGTSRTVKQQNYTPTLPLLSPGLGSQNCSSSSSSSSSSSESTLANVQEVWIRERAITSSAAKGCNEALNGALCLRNWVGEVVVNNNSNNINNNYNNKLSRNNNNSFNSKNVNEEMSSLTWTNSTKHDDELSGGTGVFVNKLKTIGQRLNWESSAYSTNFDLLSKLFKYSVAVPITVARLALLIRWSVSAPFASTYQHCFIYFLLLYAANQSSHRMYLREAKREHCQLQLFKFLQDTQKREIMREQNTSHTVQRAGANVKEAMQHSKGAVKGRIESYTQSIGNANYNDNEWKTDNENVSKYYNQQHHQKEKHHQRAIFRSWKRKSDSDKPEEKYSVKFKSSAKYRNNDDNESINESNGNSRGEDVNNNKTAREIDVTANMECKEVDTSRATARITQESEETENRNEEEDAVNYVEMIRKSYMKEYKTFRSATTMNNECIHLIVFRILPSHRPIKLNNQSNNKPNVEKSRKEFASKHFTREYDAINKYNSKSIYKYIEVLPTSTCTPREILTYLQHSTPLANGSLRNDTVSIDKRQSENNFNNHNCTENARANLANEEEYLLVFPLNLSVLRRRVKLVDSALRRHRLFCDYFVKERTHAEERCEVTKESESISEYRQNNSHLYTLTIRDLTQLTLWEHEYGEAMAAEMMTAYLRCFPDSVQLIRPDREKPNKGKRKKKKSNSVNSASHHTRHVHDKNNSLNYSS